MKKQEIHPLLPQMEAMKLNEARRILNKILLNLQHCSKGMCFSQEILPLLFMKLITETCVLTLIQGLDVYACIEVIVAIFSLSHKN